MSQRQNSLIHFGRGTSARSWQRRSVLSLASAAAVLGMAGMANADNVSWVGPSGSTAPFEVGTNWTSGNVPGGSDFAYIDNGGTASLSTFSGEILGMTLGSTVGASGSIVQGGGALTLTTNLSLGSSDAAAPTPAGSGSYTMNAGVLNDNDNFIGSKGTGTFTMNGGTLNATSNMRLGDDKGSTGVLNMHGGAINLPVFLLVG